MTKPRGRGPDHTPEQVAAQQAARKAGVKRYIGAECGVCGTSERWTSNRRCCVCQIAVLRQRQAKRAQHTKSDYVLMNCDDRWRNLILKSPWRPASGISGIGSPVVAGMIQTSLRVAS